MVVGPVKPTYIDVWAIEKEGDDDSGFGVSTLNVKVNTAPVPGFSATAHVNCE